MQNVANILSAVESTHSGLDVGGHGRVETSELSESHSLGLVILEGESADGLGSVVDLRADGVLGVSKLALGLRFSLGDSVVRLVLQVEGEHTLVSFLGLGFLGGARHADSVGRLGGVVEAGQVQGVAGERVAVALLHERVILLGKGPNDAIRSLHFFYTLR